MAFRLKPDEDIGDGLARVTRKTIRKGVTAIDGAPPAEAVHTLRKSVKKARAVVTLVEAGIDHAHRVEKRLRRVGRGLGAVRDAHAIAETFAHVAATMPPADRHALRAVQRRLRTHARRLEREAVDDGVVEKTRRKLRAAQRHLRRRGLERVREQDVLEGIRDTYRRGRRALAAAADSGHPDDFHRWRKRVKALWYQARLLAGRWETAAAVGALGELETCLGEDHNAAVLRYALRRDDRLRGTPLLRSIEHAIDAYQRRLRRKALSVGDRVYALRPRAFVQRLIGARRAKPPRRAAA